jgi:hypothetical protein
LLIVYLHKSLFKIFSYKNSKTFLKDHEDKGLSFKNWKKTGIFKKDLKDKVFTL